LVWAEKLSFRWINIRHFVQPFRKEKNGKGSPPLHLAKTPQPLPGRSKKGELQHSRLKRILLNLPHLPSRKRRKPKATAVGNPQKRNYNEEERVLRRKLWGQDLLPKKRKKILPEKNRPPRKAPKREEKGSEKETPRLPRGRGHPGKKGLVSPLPRKIEGHPLRLPPKEGNKKRELPTQIPLLKGRKRPDRPPVPIGKKGGVPGKPPLEQEMPQIQRYRKKLLKKGNPKSRTEFGGNNHPVCILLVQPL
jgi:hypothetical protein